ncbi:MAG: hypothetical protein JST54_11660 [Deltaproteobacteria bacterium]|nr:hypothetical protein [Deltaproteobacteria bacterium]
MHPRLETIAGLVPDAVRRRGWPLLCTAQAAFVLKCVSRALAQQRYGVLWLPVLSGLLLAAWAVRALVQSLRAGRPAFGLVAVVAFLALAGMASRRMAYRPEGDEPWYLLQAESLALDGDLVVEPAEAAARSPWAYGESMQPPYQLAQFDGIWRVPHWPAAALIWIPATALHKRVLGLLLQALLVALGLGAGAAVFARLSRSDAAGCALALLLLASPLTEFALLAFPDGQAAALWLLAAWLLMKPGLQRAALAGALLVLAAAMRPALLLAIPSAGVAGAWARVERPSRGEVLTFAASLVLGLAGFWVSQRLTYGAISVQPFALDLPHAPGFTFAALFEPGRGLLPNYPVWLAVALAVAWLGGPRARGLVLLAALAMGPAVAYSQSAGVGGWCPAARFWTAALPAVVAALACAWPEGSRRWRDAPAALRSGLAVVVAGALVFSTATGVVGNLVPAWSFTDGPHWLTKAAAAHFRC